MKTTNLLQYSLLIAGVFVFFVLMFTLYRSHTRTDNSDITHEKSEKQQVTTEENEDISEFFDESNTFSEDVNGSDPFDKYCKGNEGSINTFTVCAPN